MTDVRGRCPPRYVRQGTKSAGCRQLCYQGAQTDKKKVATRGHETKVRHVVANLFLLTATASSCSVGSSLTTILASSSSRDKNARQQTTLLPRGTNRRKNRNISHQRTRKSHPSCRRRPLYTQYKVPLRDVVR